MAKFLIVFEALDGSPALPLVDAEAEHADDIDVAAAGDNIDPAAWNRGAWHIRDEHDCVVRCSTE